MWGDCWAVEVRGSVNNSNLSGAAGHSDDSAAHISLHDGPPLTHSIPVEGISKLPPPSQESAQGLLLAAETAEPLPYQALDQRRPRGVRSCLSEESHVKGVRAARTTGVGVGAIFSLLCCCVSG